MDALVGVETVVVLHWLMNFGRWRGRGRELFVVINPGFDLQVGSKEIIERASSIRAVNHDATEIENSTFDDKETATKCTS